MRRESPLLLNYLNSIIMLMLIFAVRLLVFWHIRSGRLVLFFFLVVVVGWKEGGKLIDVVKEKKLVGP